MHVAYDPYEFMDVAAPVHFIRKVWQQCWFSQLGQLGMHVTAMAAYARVLQFALHNSVPFDLAAGAATAVPDPLFIVLCTGCLACSTHC